MVWLESPSHPHGVMADMEEDMEGDMVDGEEEEDGDMDANAGQLGKKELPL